MKLSPLSLVALLAAMAASENLPTNDLSGVRSLIRRSLKKNEPDQEPDLKPDQPEPDTNPPVPAPDSEEPVQPEPDTNPPVPAPDSEEPVQPEPDTNPPVPAPDSEEPVQPEPDTNPPVPAQGPATNSPTPEQNSPPPAVPDNNKRGTNQPTAALTTLSVPTTGGPTPPPATGAPTPFPTSSPSLNPTEKPTRKPTKQPTSDCRGKDAEIDHHTRSMEYLYEDECTNKYEQTYSYGQFDDGYVSLKECAEDCASEVDSDDLVGVEFTCAGEDEGRCRCLITGGETKALDTLHHHDTHHHHKFDKINIDGDATIPPEDPEVMPVSRFRFKLRNKKEHNKKDKVLCARIDPHEDEDDDDDDNTYDMWFAKDS